MTEKTVALEDLAPMAEIQTVNIGLPATERCARCQAQAYVEVEMPSGSRLEFCAHHYAENEDGLVMQAKRIIDHRPYLQTQETLYKGGIPVK